MFGVYGPQGMRACIIHSLAARLADAMIQTIWMLHLSVLLHAGLLVHLVLLEHQIPGMICLICIDTRELLYRIMRPWRFAAIKLSQSTALLMTFSLQ